MIEITHIIKRSVRDSNPRVFHHTGLAVLRYTRLSEPTPQINIKLKKEKNIWGEIKIKKKDLKTNKSSFSHHFFNQQKKRKISFFFQPSPSINYKNYYTKNKLKKRVEQ